MAQMVKHRTEVDIFLQQWIVEKKHSKQNQFFPTITRVDHLFKKNQPFICTKP